MTGFSWNDDPLAVRLLGLHKTGPNMGGIAMIREFLNADTKYPNAGFKLTDYHVMLRRTRDGCPETASYALDHGFISRNGANGSKFVDIQQAALITPIPANFCRRSATRRAALPMFRFSVPMNGLQSSTVSAASVERC